MTEGKHWGVGPTGYSLRTTVPSKVTELSPTKALVERTGPDETVWVPDPRPVPDALTDTFEAKPYDAPGIAGRDWVSLAEKLDAGGMALLMRFGGTIGEPDAGTTHTL